MKRDPYSEKSQLEFSLAGGVIGSETIMRSSKIMIRLRRLVLSFGLLGMMSGLTGCGVFRGIEQWKCDNWGMCHFAPGRPGVYSPMSVQPTAGVPMGYYGAGVATPVPYPQAGYPQGGGSVVVPSGGGSGSVPTGSNCATCNN